MPLAVVSLILNAVVAPGLGTVVGAAATGERGVLRGIAQFFLTIVFFIGWFWGIVTGVQMIRNAAWKRRTGAA